MRNSLYCRPPWVPRPTGPATAAGVEKAKVTPDQMSKYEGAISRSMSAAESITVAETLAPAIRDKAERARSVMASKESSPMSSSVAPPVSEGALSFRLPDSVTVYGAPPGAPDAPDVSDTA